MKAYSYDLRLRVLRAVDQGRKRSEIVAMFAISFSKLKAFLRRVGVRTPAALQEAISQALLTITAQDALGWFTHCGYLPQEGSKRP
jgi:hypothetical protein